LAEHVASTGEKRNACRILVGNPGGRRRIERPRRSWDYNTSNIKMDLREIGWGVMDWSHWAQNRDQWWALVNTVMNLRVPRNFGKF
jgi:hypothetical protein